MNKNAQIIFNKIDALPIVRVLQGIAVFILVIMVFQIIGYFLQGMRSPYGMQKEGLINALVLTGMTIGRALFEPALLLGLAEIIKLMRVKNDKN
jgi:hypothetical protein